MFEKKSSIDKPLLFLLLALFAVGLTALYSAGGEARFYQQLERGGGAILFMFTLSLLNLRWQQAFALSFFLVVLLALFAVLGFGVKINNARRWLNIGFYVQPSEFMKVALPLGLAFLYARLSELRLWHHLAFLAATAFVGILVLLQPDLGTAVVVFMVGVATVFFAGIGWRWIAGFSVLGVASLPLFWLFFLKAYQRNASSRCLTLFKTRWVRAITPYNLRLRWDPAAFGAKVFNPARKHSWVFCPNDTRTLSLRCMRKSSAWPVRCFYYFWRC